MARNYVSQREAHLRNVLYNYLRKEGYGNIESREISREIVNMIGGDESILRSSKPKQLLEMKDIAEQNVASEKVHIAKKLAEKQELQKLKIKQQRKEKEKLESFKKDVGRELNTFLNKPQPTRQVDDVFIGGFPASELLALRQFEEYIHDYPRYAGHILGTWLERARADHTDEEIGKAVAEAMTTSGTGLSIEIAYDSEQLYSLVFSLDDALDSDYMKRDEIANMSDDLSNYNNMM